MEKIEAGSLRQKVKSGELKAKEVLTWLETQDNVNKTFRAWLKRRA